MGREKKSKIQTHNLALYYFILWLIVYASLALIAPPDKAVLNQYNISPLVARLLSTSVVLPIISIWCVAFYGYTRLRRYAHLVTDEKDGKQIAKIASGIQILALAYPTTASITAFINLLARDNQALEKTGAIVGTYLNVSVALVAFVVIGMGARGLVDQVRRKASNTITSIIILIGAVISVMYSYLINTNNASREVYHIPLLLLNITVVIPYIFTWFTGLLAAVDLYIYSKKVQGLIYKNSWRLVSMGMATIIGSIIILQYLTTVTNRITRLPIGSLMMILYGFLAVMAAGYLLVARGSKGLRKIEEV